jgi:hypothetical protein
MGGPDELHSAVDECLLLYRHDTTTIPACHPTLLKHTTVTL